MDTTTAVIPKTTISSSSEYPRADAAIDPRETRDVGGMSRQLPQLTCRTCEVRTSARNWKPSGLEARRSELRDRTATDALQDGTRQ